MSKLTTAQRSKLPKTDFALPNFRRYPIQDEEHARYALSMMGQEPATVQREIKAAVIARYPALSTETIHDGPITGAKPPA